MSSWHDGHVGIEATEEEAEELRKVVVSGVQSVESDGRKVVYRSQGDLERTLGAAQSTASGRPRRRLAVFRSGW